MGNFRNERLLRDHLEISNLSFYFGLATPIHNAQVNPSKASARRLGISIPDLIAPPLIAIIFFPLSGPNYHRQADIKIARPLYKRPLRRH